jgi:hypothetical protein
MIISPEHKTRAYKLVRIRKDGSLGSLFINRSRRLVVGEWMEAEPHPTKGYTLRPGWHTTYTPYAPHLSLNDRVWVDVQIADFYELERPESQGGTWVIARWMKILPPPRV